MRCSARCVEILIGFIKLIALLAYALASYTTLFVSKLFKSLVLIEEFNFETANIRILKLLYFNFKLNFKNILINKQINK